MRKLASRLLLGGCLVISAAARAEPPGPGIVPLQVIAIQSDDADDQAEALTAAIRSRVRAIRWFSLVESDFALEVLTLGLKCSGVPDESCQTKIGDHIHADRYVWGTIRRSKTHRQVTAELHLWTRGRPSSRTQLTFSDNLTVPGDEALKRLVEDALGKLLEPAKSAAPVAASSTLRPTPILPANVGAPLGSSSMQKATPIPSDALEEPGDGHRTAGWAGLGLGGILLAAGVYSVVRVHAIDTDQRVELYRQGFYSGTDICDEARSGIESKVAGAATATQMRDFCSSATTFQTLQYIFFGLGAVSSGAGIYLLATDKHGGATAGSRVSVSPLVGRSGGRLEMTVSF